MRLQRGQGMSRDWSSNMGCSHRQSAGHAVCACVSRTSVRGAGSRAGRGIRGPLSGTFTLGTGPADQKPVLWSGSRTFDPSRSGLPRSGVSHVAGWVGGHAPAASLLDLGRGAASPAFSGRVRFLLPLRSDDIPASGQLARAVAALARAPFFHPARRTPHCSGRCRGRDLLLLLRRVSRPRRFFVRGAA